MLISSIVWASVILACSLNPGSSSKEMTYIFLSGFSSNSSEFPRLTSHLKKTTGVSFVLSFQLDDRDETLIEEPIIIRSVSRGQEVGAELLAEYSFELDIYLNSR